MTITSSSNFPEMFGTPSCCFPYRVCGGCQDTETFKCTWHGLSVLTGPACPSSSPIGMLALVLSRTGHQDVLVTLVSLSGLNPQPPKLGIGIPKSSVALKRLIHGLQLLGRRKCVTQKGCERSNNPCTIADLLVF